MPLTRRILVAGALAALTLAPTDRAARADAPVVVFAAASLKNALDDAAAAELRGLVVDTVDRAGMSVLMVTHNVAEAIGIADRLLLVSRRPASLIADVRLDRPRRDRDRAWAETTRANLAARHPEIIAQ